MSINPNAHQVALANLATQSASSLKRLFSHFDEADTLYLVNSDLNVDQLIGSETLAAGAGRLKQANDLNACLNREVILYLDVDLTKLGGATIRDNMLKLSATLHSLYASLKNVPNLYYSGIVITVGAPSNAPAEIFQTSVAACLMAMHGALNAHIQHDAIETHGHFVNSHEAAKLDLPYVPLHMFAFRHESMVSKPAAVVVPSWTNLLNRNPGSEPVVEEPIVAQVAPAPEEPMPGSELLTEPAPEAPPREALTIAESVEAIDESLQHLGEVEDELRMATMLLEAGADLKGTSPFNYIILPALMGVKPVRLALSSSGIFVTEEAAQHKHPNAITIVMETTRAVDIASDVESDGHVGLFDIDPMAAVSGHINPTEVLEYVVSAIQIEALTPTDAAMLEKTFGSIDLLRGHLEEFLNVMPSQLA